MSILQYQITVLPNGDILPQGLPNPGSPFPVKFNDPDFQAWLAQQTPAVQATAVLSPRQQMIQTIKALTLAQWIDGITLTTAQKDKIAYFAMKLAFEDEIV